MVSVRRGRKRAPLAVAHTILVIAYELLRTRTTYPDLGAAYLDHVSKHHTRRHLVRRLEALGYRITLEAA